MYGFCLLIVIYWISICLGCNEMHNYTCNFYAELPCGLKQLRSGFQLFLCLALKAVQWENKSEQIKRVYQILVIIPKWPFVEFSHRHFTFVFSCHASPLFSHYPFFAPQLIIECLVEMRVQAWGAYFLFFVLILFGQQSSMICILSKSVVVSDDTK